MIKLSIIIPSYKDPLSMKTIADLLAKSELGDQLEIIDVLDGYWPSFEMIQDPRVRYVHLGKNRGMRGAINAGVAVARGEFLMRVDEHQMFGQGYDRILTSQCKPNWIFTPKRYFLDTVKWEVMDLEPVESSKLVVSGGKFAGVPWKSHSKKHEKDQMYATMAMQGSCWVMPRKWWNEVIGELQTEGYGPLIQDSHEMVFKTWKAGGHLVVNKNTWHAHKHRSFPRTHNNGTPDNPANCEQGYKYALDVWGDYYEKEVRPKWHV